LAQRDAIRTTLEALPVVKDVYYETQTEAYQHFLQRFQGTTIAQTVSPQDLPESFRVSLKDASKFTDVATAVSSMPGVDIVKDQRNQNKRLFLLLDGLRWLALGFAIAMLLATMLLVVNTMRVAAYSRRREVGIMRLVGAANSYIRLPFLLEAVFAALGGIALTIGVLVAVKAGLVDHVFAPTYKFTSFIGWAPVWEACALVAVVGLLLAVLTAGASLRRYLKA
jgi:cell division transport system permease protein